MSPTPRAIDSWVKSLGYYYSYAKTRSLPEEIAGCGFGVEENFLLHRRAVIMLVGRDEMEAKQFLSFDETGFVSSI